MIELKGKITAQELTKRLLIDHNLFIRDLTNKIGKTYIRIAIITTEDNNKLLEALKTEVK